MDPTRCFADLVQRDEAEVPLDEATALIAAHAYPGLDVAAVTGRLDELAAGVACPTLDGLVEHLFGALGFAGNAGDYYDPRNSYLNDVLDRRVGIPISLAVVTLSVGRRIGVPLAGVGMPGHFLLRDRVDPSVFVDPFAGGSVLDAAGCEAAFRQVHGADVRFDPAYLAPVGSHAILARILANLRGVFAARGDRTGLRWALQLRCLVPGGPPEERAELATVLAADGAFGEAAGELECLAAELGGDLGARYRAEASRYRARLN